CPACCEDGPCKEKPCCTEAAVSVVPIVSRIVVPEPETSAVTEGCAENALRQLAHDHFHDWSLGQRENDILRRGVVLNETELDPDVTCGGIYVEFQNFRPVGETESYTYDAGT